MTSADRASWKRLRLWMVVLTLLLAVPALSSAQEGPRPGLVPPPGSNHVTIGPGHRYAGDVVASGRYWIWLSPTRAGAYATWPWVRWGPYVLQGRLRYEAVVREGMVFALQGGGTRPLDVNLGPKVTQVAVTNRTNIWIGTVLPPQPAPAAAAGPAAQPGPARLTFNIGKYARIQGAVPGNSSWPNVFVNPDATDRPNAVEFDFQVPCNCKYRLGIEYAAAVPRPVQIFLDGRLVAGNALNGTTGGWSLAYQRWERGIAILSLTGGRTHTLRIARDHVFPHIRTVELVLVR